ncbi:MAG: GNAT family N-acetyltransferase [Candidatus Dormiibacterota bacterium]
MALLLAELGYPLSAAEAEKRLARTEQQVLVAAADGQVIGLLAVSTLLSLTRAKPVLWVNAIVVATGARGHGVGRALMLAAEDGAAALGCEAMEMTPGIHDGREAAHRLYDALDYLRTAHHLSKPPPNRASTP